MCEALRGGLFARTARIFAAEARGNSAGKVRAATGNGLDKESRIHGALPQVSREKENVSTGCVNAVAHRGNLDARFACRGPASGNGMTDDNRTCCARVLSRLIIGTVVDDDE